MIEKELKILNEDGLHARPAGIFVKAAGVFKSKVLLKTDQASVNAKSIMNVMSLGLTNGMKVTLVADGEDESLALEKLSEIINNRFEA